MSGLCNAIEFRQLLSNRFVLHSLKQWRQSEPCIKNIGTVEVGGFGVGGLGLGYAELFFGRASERTFPELRQHLRGDGKGQRMVDRTLRSKHRFCAWGWGLRGGWDETKCIERGSTP